MTESQPFEAVLVAARAGEEWALTHLYRSLQPPLLGYLRSQRADIADDLASETWIAVARGLGRFRGDESDFRRWVFTIARRRLLDELRSEGRRPRGAPLVEPEGEPAHGDAESEALDALATQRALETIGLLPAHEAEIVLLRVVAGLSAHDVGRITGRSAGSVRVLQHRALRRLAGLVGKTLVTLAGRLAM